ncbi:cell cycle checkpoint protein [Niveomyces insectorum RCEF 264]|uniref:Checkpoint protein n=1 Tax=Niveomyces insectorum RCEF 264 TaxID=1081102 RepID=A0A167Z1N9_9HYPO|nr:cell cycle checkpoint protein [Niveomyces insectorum RCEF 264]
MKFKAELRNIRTFSKLVAALNALDKIVWIRLEDDVVRFIVVPDRGSQVWSTFHREFLFDGYILQSLNANNAIDLELPLAALQRALKSALNSTDAVLRLTKRDGVPVLSMTIHTMTNLRSGFGGGGGGGGTAGFGASGGGVGSGRSRGGGGGGGYGRESTFGDTGTADAALSQLPSSSTHDPAAAAALLDLTVKREREKVVVQDMPVRVMAAEAFGSALEPTVPEADVNIVLPPLLQLKAVSDRFTKLGGGVSTGGTMGGGGGSGSTAMSSTTTTSSSASPKLEISANMYGMLRLRLVTDALSVETVWHDLENPPLNEAALPVPLAEHPSTRYREAGPDRFATVRVDGRDWSRVLGVGRLERSRVIACFIDGTALILHVYVAQPDDPDDPEETSSITYYVSSYSS